MIARDRDGFLVGNVAACAATLLPADAERLRDSFLRTDQHARCEGCGREHREHPRDVPPFELLHILCDGTRVKL